MGFWFVRKLVLCDGESIDPKTSLFVKVSIYLLGFFLLLETTLDFWLALEASVGGILVSIILRRVASPRTLRKRYRSLFKRTSSNSRRSPVPDSSPFRESLDSYVYGIKQRRDMAFTPAPFNTVGVLARTPPARRSPGPEIYFSTIHDTPRRKFSKNEWEKFTRDSTKQALEGLVSSPDFSRWAAANAERLTLKPKGDSSSARPRSRWWFLGS